MDCGIISGALCSERSRADKTDRSFQTGFIKVSPILIKTISNLVAEIKSAKITAFSIFVCGAERYWENIPITYWYRKKSLQVFHRFY